MHQHIDGAEHQYNDQDGCEEEKNMRDVEAGEEIAAGESAHSKSMVDTVEHGRDNEGQGNDQDAEEAEELEADPTPGAAAVLAPERADKLVAGCDQFEQDELQAGTNVEEDEADD